MLINIFKKTDKRCFPHFTSIVPITVSVSRNWDAKAPAFQPTIHRLLPIFPPAGGGDMIAQTHIAPLGFVQLALWKRPSYQALAFKLQPQAWRQDGVTAMRGIRTSSWPCPSPRIFFPWKTLPGTLSFTQHSF